MTAGDFVVRAGVRTRWALPHSFPCDWAGGVASAPGRGTVFQAVAWLLVVPQVCSTWHVLVSLWLLGWLDGWASVRLHAARPGLPPAHRSLSGHADCLCGWDFSQSLSASCWAPPSVEGDHPGGQGLGLTGGLGGVVGFRFLWIRLDKCSEGRPASMAPYLGLRREEVPGLSDFEVGEGPNHLPL